MAVTNPYAVKFCNDVVRIAADRLAQAYYRADAARDRWDALGGGQTAIDAMERDIRHACDRIIELYEFCFRAEKVWFLGMNAIIPNNAGEAIFDNGDLSAPDPARPPANGQKVHALMGRVIQLQNWLLSAAGSFGDANRAGAAYYNTVLEASSSGPVTMSVAAAGNAMNRFAELRANFDANTNQNLGAILALAVNPLQ